MNHLCPPVSCCARLLMSAWTVLAPAFGPLAADRALKLCPRQFALTDEERACWAFQPVKELAVPKKEFRDWQATVPRLMGLGHECLAGFCGGLNHRLTVVVEATPIRGLIA